MPKLEGFVDTLESVDEQYRDLYLEHTDKDGKTTFRLDATGVEDVSGLKSALEKERSLKKDAIKGMEEVTARFEGIDPDEIADLRTKAGRVDELEATKNEEWDKLKAGIETKHAAQLEAKDKVIASKDAALHKHLVESTAKSAIAAAGGSVELLLPHVVSKARVVEEDGQHHVRVIGADGGPRAGGEGWMTIAGLVTELKESETFGPAFKASDAAGSGAGAGDKKAPTGKHRYRSKADFKNAKEKSDFIAEHGQAAYSSLPMKAA